MAKILVLAKSGFGKTTAYCGREKYGIKGLNPSNTFVIQCVGRAVSNPNFKLCKDATVTQDNLMSGNRIQVDSISGIERFKVVADLFNALKGSPYKNIVVDDFNYLSQDFYMANAMKGGWDVPKQIGYGMGLIFNALQSYPEDKNVFLCAHYEEFKDKNGDSISYKFKSIGNMTDGYITPEGKVDIILYGKQSFDAQTKAPVKVFVKEFDGQYPAKDSIGALDALPDEFPNDLGIVEAAIDKFYGRQ